MFRRIVFLAIAVLLPILLFSRQGVQKTAVSAAPPAEETHKASADNVYFIALDVPPLDSLEIDVPVGPEGLETAVWQAFKQQAHPVVIELDQLQARGLIHGYELQQETHSIAVHGVSTPDDLQLTHSQIMIYQNELPACAAGSAAALREQMIGLMQSHAAQERVLPQTATAVPSIDVYILPGSEYSYVRGTADANTQVTMTLFRNGQSVASQTTTSSSNGYYSLSPYWQSCPYRHYSWQAKAGDVVQISAGGQTAVTTVVDLTVSTNPVTNIVSGTTASGRNVWIDLYQPHTGDCNADLESKQTVAGSGSFSVNFSSSVDFNRAAYAYVYAQDGNGNSTYSYSHAHTLGAYFDRDDFWGTIPPLSNYTAKLKRGGSTIDTVTGKSSGYGHLYNEFSDIIEPGDIIQLTGANFTNFSYTAVGLTATINPNNNKLTGSTAANRTVNARFYKRSEQYDAVATSCSFAYQCNYATSNGGGSFAVNANMDVERGDYAYVYVYDSNGMYQYSTGGINAAAIVASLNSSQIRGFSSASYATIALTLKNSSGGVKDTDTAYSGYDGEFYEWMGSTIEVGDIIEMDDGIVTTSMTVQNLDTILNSSTDRLNGTASGKVLAFLTDYNSGFYWQSRCATTSAGGTVNLAFSGADMDGQDYANVLNTGPDGHYTYLHNRAFTVNIEPDADYVNGYATHRETAVTIKHKRNGAVLQTVNKTSSTYNGYFYANLSNDLKIGDQIVVTSNQGDAKTLTVPTLTVYIPADKNELRGTGPANKQVFVLLNRHYNYGWYGWGFYQTVTPGGTFTASFNTGYDYYWGYDCSTVEVQGHCNQALARYYTPDGHQTLVYTPYPDDAPADNYENDDTYATAKTYNNTQSHSFDVSSDVDWIKFTVSHQDLGKTFYLETINLGWGMDTVLSLYDTDGTTLIATNDDGGVGAASLIAWQPTTTGTYYVKVAPFSSSHTAYCDAKYDFTITKNRIFLPFIQKQ